MKMKLCTALILLLAAALVAACQPAAPGAGPAAAPAGAWEQKWKDAMAKGKTEGSVAIYNQWQPRLRTALGDAFKEKYGITLEFSNFARGPEALAKVKAENRAGLFLADIFGIGTFTHTNLLKPEGLLGPVDALLILPEVTGPSNWNNGKLPFREKDKISVDLVDVVQPYIMYNTDLVKKGEITTYNDVLKPQYKGKVTLNDPSITGAGNAMMTHLAYNVWSMNEATEFLRRLVKEQEVVIQRDLRLHVESVARGKYAIGLGPQVDVIDELLRMGAPIDVVINKEGTFVTGAAGAIAVSSKPAHPNATAVFVNWVMSKEGQIIFSKAYGAASTRADVPVEGLVSFLVPKNWEKLYWDTEELIAARSKMVDVNKKTIEDATK
ncbi:MAG: extracellular solute-binding protein [Chloroflexi bacterium]|nr:extracellular solute-binding protein [Chloroflexota bacterium]